MPLETAEVGGSNGYEQHNTALEERGLDHGPLFLCRTAGSQGRARLGIVSDMDVYLPDAGYGRSQAEEPETVRAMLDSVERKQAAMAESEVDVARDLSARLFAAGGKRIRPRLVVLSALVCGARSGDERVIDLAAAAELVHSASLVHDDVIDETAERRGVATTNARWGNKLSVLGGDFLLSKAFSLLAGVGSAEVMRAISAMAVRMTEAEMLQAVSEGSIEKWQANYWRVITGKTASFMGACCECGAIIAGASPEVRSALTSYGEQLGIAFQITDDLLDIVGDPCVTGKDLGADLIGGKYTLPVLTAMRDPQVGEQCRSILISRNGDLTPKDAGEVARLVRECGAAETARQTALEHSQRACDQLDSLPPSDYTRALRSLAASVVDREG